MTILPPPSWVAALCAALGVFLSVSYFRQRDPLTREPRRVLGLAAAGTVLGAVVIGGRIALRLPGVPYNVRELAGASPTFSLMALGVALMTCGGLPMAFASLWQRRPRAFARRYGPLLVGVATAVFFAAWFVVPVESIDDIVGTPVLKISDTTERWVRFVALFGGLLSGWTVGARLALRDLRVRPLLIGICVTGAAMLISYVVVVPLAATNNIYELLRGRGGVGAAVGIAGYLIVSSAVFAMLAWSLVLSRGRLAVATPLLVLVLSVPVAWQLFVFASNPRLNKYGRVFSARQFLFSPDRDHYLDDRQIFLRFAVVQIGLACILAGGAAAVLAVVSTTSKGGEDR